MRHLLGHLQAYFMTHQKHEYYEKRRRKTAVCYQAVFGVRTQLLKRSYHYGVSKEMVLQVASLLRSPELTFKVRYDKSAKRFNIFLTKFKRKED